MRSSGSLPETPRASSMKKRFSQPDRWTPDMPSRRTALAAAAALMAVGLWPSPSSDAVQAQERALADERREPR